MNNHNSLATEFGDADDSPGLLLWQVTNRWQSAQRAALKPFGLTHVQFVLLASLTWLGSEVPVTQRLLSEHAATDPMMTSQVLRTLEAKGFVTRAAHPSDSRAKALAVTAKGRALANSANAAVERCDREFFAPLGARRGDFAALLRSVKAGSA